VPLRLGINSYRPDAADRAAFVKKVRADDPVLSLGDDAPDRRMGDEVADQLYGRFERGEVALGLPRRHACSLHRQ
jgi:hypothetical protein